MDGLNLKEKLGPLPAWMWALALVLVVLVGYMFVRNGRQSSAPVSTGSNIDGTVGYQTSGLSGANSNNSSNYTTPDNNQAWLTRVAAQVAANMSKSPSEVYAALQLWLSGQDITTDQKAIVDRALQIGGNPPEAVQGTSVVNPPAPTKKFVGFVRNPVGTIAALFSDNTVSEYNDFAVYQAANKAEGNPGYVQLTAGQYNTYTKNAQNYQPGFGV